MTPVELAFLFTLIAFFAHIIKGLTGFGPAIVFVSVGSILHDPVEVIVLASLLDIVGGAYLTFLNPDFLDNKKYWVPVGILMVIGAIIGGAVLSVIPPTAFEYILGVSIIIIAIWFVIGESDPDDGAEREDFNLPDAGVGLFSGFCGGFTGMGGPPLIAYLGSKLDKELFRAVIVPIFLVAAISRFSTYGALGMIELTNYLFYILPPVGVLFGNYVGNYFFEHVEQKWFTILIGIILMLSGIRLIVT